MCDELDIIDKVLKGDAEAFEYIVYKYENAIVRFIYNMINNKESAEDLTQEVFISAFKKLYTFSREYKFSTWLYQIAKNKCIDFMRKQKRSKEICAEEVKLNSEDISPENYVVYRETKSNIEEFIKTLKDIDRQILVLRYSSKLTFMDIAILLNMGDSAVKKRYYKIYDKFEKYLEGGSQRDLQRV